jgi:7-carboxy-7-deazaguanine synthase
MGKTRINEVYISIQGEGPRVGAPTVFIRFAGCNLRCPGWACDTPHAIDPALYRVDSKLLSATEVGELVEASAPFGANVCFTGGEPFLQNGEALKEIVDELKHRELMVFEVFTNGTLEFPDWAYDDLYFVMDWKLGGAGENDYLKNVKINATRIKNVQRMNEGDVVKFTIASYEDYQEAKEAYNNLTTLNVAVEFIYGVVWGKLEAKNLIEWVLRDGLVEWTYSHQLHNVIWDRDKRGI